MNDDAPTVSFLVPRRRRWPLVAATSALVVVAALGAAVLVWWPSPAPAPVSAAAALPSVAFPAGPAPTIAPTTTRPRGTCPDADALVAAYRADGTSTGRDGAVSRSAVTCAGGFAVMKVHSPGDSETVSAIFSVGPPVRFREAGSGPICTDDAASMPGAVLVPKAAAAKLGCVTMADSSSASPAGAPTLGSVWSGNQKGFGDSRPTEINAGGDSTGVVEGITWSTWGGATARGTGTGYWIGPDQYSYQATQAPAVVIVDRLGTCQGHAAYLRVRWYFPTHGETAPASDTGFADICGT